MDATDELLTIAELAIALAGFAGVVVAFSQRGQLLRTDQWRFVGVLSSSVDRCYWPLPLDRRSRTPE